MIMKGGAYVARAKRVPGVEERSENYPINATLLAIGHTVNRIHSTYICWIIQQSELVFVHGEPGIFDVPNFCLQSELDVRWVEDWWKVGRDRDYNN